MQIQAYLDNVFDVGTLLEDAETKTAALERVEELEESMTHVRREHTHLNTWLRTHIFKHTHRNTLGYSDTYTHTRSDTHTHIYTHTHKYTHRASPWHQDTNESWFVLTVVPV